MKDGGFTFSYVDRLYFSYQKINLKRAGSNTKLLDWLRNKEANINSQNNKKMML